jgi:ribosomal protein S4
MGIALLKRARQLVSHRHITVNGDVANITSYLKPGDEVTSS